MQASQIIICDPFESTLPETLFIRMNCETVQIKNQIIETNVFSPIKQWKARTIEFDQNQQKNIIREIKAINFSNLREVIFCKNNIETIEGFHRIQLPCLKLLYLSWNKILNFKDLRKIYLPLNDVRIHENKVSDGQQMERFFHKQLEYLSLDHTVSFVSEDLRWVEKLESSKLKQLWVYNNKRIKQPQIRAKIQQKYLQLMIE